MIARAEEAGPPVPLARCLEDEAEDPERLREDILQHFRLLGLPAQDGLSSAPASKAAIRSMHSRQRSELLQRELAALRPRLPGLLDHFADGVQVDPERISPELIPVQSDQPTGDLFRFATLLWSVPVSRGYGRRMRYLVRDRQNGKLMGLFALTDPVFNLRARDSWIGWSAEQRRAGLVHVMDAHVVGAVPPYSGLLGGKLITALIGSRDVSEAFAARYGETEGIISRKRKAARLVLVTVTSALGRSSIYNRLLLLAESGPTGGGPVLAELIRVGSTRGYGHFHLSEDLFRRLRRLLIARNHPYANGYAFGNGPNWRLRLTRVGLGILGLDPNLVRHGVSREAYVMPLGHDCRSFLCGRSEMIALQRPTADEISRAALSRWVRPRARRRPEYASFCRTELLASLADA